ncbi:unnamed protein product [Caenorhabditis bovis]|uniref:Uncharacterized protein n=1 Tax=Caenorhabditis bovis TaxID=2654633 RepID=A0A8S1F7Q5_9PELO|nr:unnamed protein product [Caenorhabditis bovis]
MLIIPSASLQVDMSSSPEHTATTSASATPPPTATAAGIPNSTTPQMSGGGDQQQVPFQMIPPGAHFFANPFMNPYMAAADMNSWQNGGQSAESIKDGQPTTQAAPMPMMIAPAQYQEMMQHYLQQMMAASGAQFPIPFPMQFQPATTAAFLNNHQPRPSSQCSSSHKSEDDGRRTAGSVTSNVSPNHREVGNDAETFKDEKLPTEIACSSTTTDQGSPDLFDRVDEVNELEQNKEPIAEIIGDVIKDSKEQGSEKPTMNEKSDGDEKRKMSGESSSDRTDSLIRKQMSEIEKEITRRSQNKNIKQSALPYTAPSTSADKPAVVKESLNQLRSSFNLNEEKPQQLPQELHQVQQSAPFQFVANSNPFSPQNAFPIGVTMPQQSAFSTAPQFAMMPQQQHFMQPQGTGFVTNGTNPFAPQLNPSFIQQPIGAAQQQASHHFTPDQLAAVFAQQQIAQQAACTSGIAPPPPPAHPIARKSSSGGWPAEDNKENGSSSSTTTTGANPQAPNGSDPNDPVWVLRDSYLKKMQREQRNSAEEEMSWHEAATAAQEAAENGNVDEEEQETDRLLNGGEGVTKSTMDRTSIDKKKNSKEALVHEPAVLIEGVLFRARYLGSTQMLCESRGSKAARMAQAQEAVARVKAPEGDVQPSTEIDLFISTEKIMVLNTDLQRISDTDVRQDILMDHALRTISYIADIGDLVVLMARRMSTSHSDESCNENENGVRKTPKVICHVFESDEASFIAQSIGQAFQVAYVEFLRANGIDDPSYLRQIDYQEVLNSQELLGDELEMFAKKETQKEVVIPKKSGEPLGIVVVESGWGSMLPTVVLAHMNPTGPAAHSNKLNIGDQIININGISLVGLPLSAAQTQIKNVKTATAVRMTVVSTPPVVEVRIRRPDTKYQLGFSVQNGVICSLLRGGIAERGGIRVGHRIIEINGTSVVAVAHDRIVNMLATAVGEIHMKTMPTSMFRLLTGQETPQYI